ncbi:hypothetical protein [Actinomyces sp. zg296]|uniref:hypothetical protein n=1 Tax=Actinomyces sp. zg296 TaxID=2609289 RepID=UPI00135986E7|nr:hypothetical protein [Actinomyces sp. zg296]
MNRRLLSAIVAAAGLIVIALAVCFATVWRPSSTIEATLPTSPEQNYAVTAPGVLNLIDSSVTIKATAADGSSPVVIAVGHEADVKAWLARDPYLSVTGLADEKTLQASPVTEACDSSGACSEATPSNADPTSSDLWSDKAKGTGSASAVVNVSSSDMVALIATDGSGPAPSVSLSWERTVSTWWFMPSLILGGLLILVGVFGLLLDFQNRRVEAERRNRAAERQARLDAADGVPTAAVPSVEDPDRPLTRREKRDKERAERQGEEWVDPRTGRAYVGGVEVPSIPSSPEALTAQGAGAASAAPSISATSNDPHSGAPATTPPSGGAAGALGAPDEAGWGGPRPDQGGGMTAHERPWESATASLPPLGPAEPVDYFGTAILGGDGAQALRPAPSMIPGSAPYFQVDDPRGSSASAAPPASPPVDLPAHRAGSSGPSTEDLGELGLGRSADGQGAGGARDDKETI